MRTGDRPDPLAEPEGYGVRPGQTQEQPVSPRCRADDGKCDGVTCYRLWIGDKAEHVWPLDLCTRHAAQHVGQSALMRCTVCKDWAVLIKVEGFHGFDPADLLKPLAKAAPDLGMDAAVRWAFGGPGTPHPQ